MPTATAAPLPLPPPCLKGQLPLEQCLASRRSVRGYRPLALKLEEIAQLLWAAQGVTNDEGYRTAPSAGATLPLEVYVATRKVEGLGPGLYRYCPDGHALTRVLEGDCVKALAAASGEQDCVRYCQAVLIFCAVFARTMGKYGERGRFYVWAEVGHASQNVYLQAVSLKLATVAVGAFDPEQVRLAATLAPDEEPLYMMPLGRK